MHYAAIRITVSLVASMTIGLAACQAAPLGPSSTPSTPGSPSGSPSSSPTPGKTETSSPSASPASTPAAAEPAPFACEPLDIRSQADQTHTLIADVRVGTHAGYDRVVVEFGPPFPGAPAGVPEYIVHAAQRPLRQDPSGLEMEVPGTHHLELALLGATKYDEDYNLRYSGPTRLDPSFPALVALYERGDFEATSTWYLGLDQEPCLRVFTLTGPMRLVVDIAH